MYSFKIALIGFVVVVVDLWGGSYVLHEVSMTDWKHFPMFVTSFAIGAIGLVTFCIGAAPKGN